MSGWNRLQVPPHNSILNPTRGSHISCAFTRVHLSPPPLPHFKMPPTRKPKSLFSNSGEQNHGAEPLTDSEKVTIIHKKPDNPPLNRRITRAQAVRASVQPDETSSSSASTRKRKQPEETSLSSASNRKRKQPEETSLSSASTRKRQQPEETSSLSASTRQHNKHVESSEVPQRRLKKQPPNPPAETSQNSRNAPEIPPNKSVRDAAEILKRWQDYRAQVDPSRWTLQSMKDNVCGKVARLRYHMGKILPEIYNADPKSLEGKAALRVLKQLFTDITKVSLDFYRPFFWHEMCPPRHLNPYNGRFLDSEFLWLDPD